MNSSASADLALMRASVLLASDPAGAAQRATEILAAWPRHAEASLLLATACRRLGDSATAVTVLESLIGMHATAAPLHLELAQAYAGAGRCAAALASCSRAVELDSGFADAWRELATLRFQAGDVVGGDAAYASFMALAPEPPELNEIKLALTQRRYEAADRMLRQHLCDRPRDVAALRLMAETDTQRGDLRAAERRLEEALAYAPGDAVSRFELANLLFSMQRIPEMLPLLERLLAAAPDNNDYLMLKAQAIRFLGRNAEADVLMERILAVRPDSVLALVAFGIMLRESGDYPRAVDLLRRAIALKPEFGEPYWHLADIKTYRFPANEVDAMRALLARGSLAESDRIHLEFALGKASEDAADYATSFAHYARGNGARRATINYDPALTSARVARPRARADWGVADPDPIFIVGLPRSGSTLLEQMLASHSQVEGTQELPDVRNLIWKLIAATATGDAEIEYPGVIAALARAQNTQLAQRYLELTAVHRPLGTPRFVDKMLGNFQHIALIHQMFPRAAIIDTRRHPLACGFSCYKQLFAQMNYTYDLAEFGRYYRDYVELMAHFDRVLPGRVHRVHYELMVADPERELRRLLDYCGLPFEPGCLRYYENRRVVRTVSAEQVRRPIYATAVDQWRHYEPWLGPLQTEVAELVTIYPASGPEPA